MRLAVLCFLLAGLVFTSACAPKNIKSAPPHATIARYGTTILENTTELQKAVTSATVAGSLEVEIARRIQTIAKEKIADNATILEAALVAYDQAVSLDDQTSALQKAQIALVAINTGLSELYNVDAGDSAASNFLELLATISKAVSVAQLEVAKVVASARTGSS